MTRRVTRAMRLDRLRQLRDLMQRISKADGPTPKFGMGSWARSVSRSAPPKNVCGTSACALGHAALDPWFRGRGLRLRIGSIDIVKPEDLLRALDIYPHGEGLVWFDGASGSAAGMRFFGITYEEASGLFLPGSYSKFASRITAEDVAERVANLIAYYEDQPPKT